MEAKCKAPYMEEYLESVRIVCSVCGGNIFYHMTEDFRYECVKCGAEERKPYGDYTALICKRYNSEVPFEEQLW